MSDPWRIYRIGAGVLTGMVGLYAIVAILMITYFFTVIVAGIITLFTAIFGGAVSLPDLGGLVELAGSLWLLVILAGVIGFGVFAHAGFRFAVDTNSGRVFVWVAALLSLPVGLFAIFVLLRTRPGTNHAPPDGRLASGVIGVSAVLFFGGVGLEFAEDLGQKWGNYQRQDNAFIQSISWGSEDKLKALLEGGADPNQTTKLGATPLMIALDKHLYKHVVLLLEHGADPNTPSWYQSGAEYRLLVSERQNEEGLARWLDMDKLRGSYQKHTPLVVIANLDKTDIVRLMLEKGADVNARQNYQNLETPLVDTLAASGLSFRFKFQAVTQERSALEWAVDGFNLELVDLLLTSGATVDPNILATASYHLFGKQNFEDKSKIVVALLDHGANVNPPGRHSPLVAAERNRNPKMVKLLMEHGAAPHQMSDNQLP